MEDITQYTNEFGVEIQIARQNLPEINTIIEDYSENGMLVHRTILEDEKIQSQLFFAFSIEQVKQIVEQTPTISIIYRTFKNDYQIDEHIYYTNKLLSAKTVSVKNENSEPICFRHFQVENGEIKSYSTEKSYFENGEEKYSFDYNPDGTCFMVNSTPTFDEDIFGWEIGTNSTLFTWKGFEYYQYAEPLVPENNITS